VRSSAGNPTGRLDARARVAGHTAALGLGTVIAGLAAYVYIAVGTREFGAAAFAPVAVIWSCWPAAAAAFALPLEQWIARETASGPAGEARVRATLRIALPVIGGLCLAGGAIAWAAGERLFGARDALYPAVLVAVSAGAASMGVLRGGLAGRGRYVASATATALENLVRLVAALGAVAAGWGLRAYAAVLVLGPLVGALWPGAFRFRGDAAGAASGVRELRELSGAALLAQVVLSAPPVVVAALLGPTAAVTASFAALALLRAPYLVAVGISIRALPPLTRRLAGAAAPPSWLARIALITAAAAGVAALVAPYVLPPVIRLVFGDDAVPGDAAVAGLAAGVAAAHGALAATVVLVAARRQGLVLRAWLAACAVNAALLALPLDAEPRAALAFAVAELVAVAAMALGALRVAGYAAPAVDLG
jgi:O-antigen/teichoic acid export membrane protein